MPITISEQNGGVLIGVRVIPRASKSEIIGESRTDFWVGPIITAGFSVLSVDGNSATVSLDPERVIVGAIFIVESFWGEYTLDYAGLNPIFYDFKTVHCDTMGELIDKLRETQKEYQRRRDLERADSLETLGNELKT